MDLSEFKPPVRLSMSDEDIQAALGSAAANEEGMLAAMAMLEEQATLRDQDNQALAAWVAKMQADPRPEAAIALQNLERSKAGLEPLPFEPVVEPVEEPVVELVVEPVFEPVAEEQEPVADDFDSILMEATAEATTAVELPAAPAEPEVVEIEAAPVDNFEVSADEDAVVFEEQQSMKPAEPKDRAWLFRLGSWALFGAVFPAIALGVFSALSFSGFANLTIGFAVGSTLAYGVHLTGFATASRSDRGLSVISRATFGVWGAGLPGVVSLLARLSLFIGLLLFVVNSTALAFPELPKASDPVVLGVPFGLILSASLAVAVGLVVAFASGVLRWIYAVSGVLVLLAGLALAIASMGAIDFSSLNTNVNAATVFTTAAITFLVQGVATFGLESRGFAIKSKLPSGWLQQVLFPVFYVLIPVALFAHVQAIFDTNAINFLFDPSGILQNVFGDFAGVVSAVTPWLAIVAVVSFLLGLFDSAVESTGALGANARTWWQALLLVVVAVFALVALPEQETWLQVSMVALIAFAANLGAIAADALLRRGSYHDASLLRGYGFYQRFNVLGLVTYVVALAAALLLTKTFSLRSFGVDIESVIDSLAPYSAFIMFGITFVLSFAISIPRIREQQAEAKDIEERRQALASVYAG